MRALIALLPLLLVTGHSAPEPPPADGHIAVPAAHSADASQPASEAAHAGHGEAARAEPPVPPAGQRWQADAALTRGMQQLRELSLDLERLPDRADAATLATFGERIEHTVHKLFAECRLEPEPDAALHAMLVEVLDARRQLGSAQPDAAAAQVTLERVLRQYREHFVDQP